MSSKTITICDRCNKEINYIGETSILRGLKEPRRFSFRILFNGNNSGYDYLNHDFELCNSCTCALKKFLENEGE